MTNASSKSITIHLKGVSKKFGRNWIFRKVTYDFYQGKKYAISGPNGSGKSTLLKIIAGIVTPNEGKAEVEQNGKTIAYEDLYKQISFCSPYMDLPEELTLTELLDFHTRLRQLSIRPEQFRKELDLEPEKEIRNYSSGMKQRLKLALALYTESAIILLDEPSATLDKHWIEWYFDRVQKLSVGKLLIISSNIPEEYGFCDAVMDLAGYNIMAAQQK